MNDQTSNGAVPKNGSPTKKKAKHKKKDTHQNGETDLLAVENKQTVENFGSSKGKSAGKNSKKKKPNHFNKKKVEIDDENSNKKKVDIENGTSKKKKVKTEDEKSKKEKVKSEDEKSKKEKVKSEDENSNRKTVEMEDENSNRKTVEMEDDSDEEIPILMSPDGVEVGILMHSKASLAKLNIPITDEKTLYEFEQNFVFPLKKAPYKNPRALFQCSLCKYHCDTVEVVERHIKDERHRLAYDEEINRLSMFHIPLPLPQQLEYLTHVVEKESEINGLSEEDYLARKKIASDLDEAFSALLPGTKVRLYGSSLSKFALKCSNVNLELCVPNESEAPKSLKEMHAYVNTQTAKYSEVKREFSTKIPAVKFIDKATNLACTLTLSDDHSYRTSELLAKYGDIDPRVRKLGTMFRIWAKACRLDIPDCGMLPPFAFSIMIVHFLQQINPPVLPVLHELVDSKEGERDAEKYLDPKDLSGKWTCENDMSLGELWLLLLRFYSTDCDISGRVISIDQLKPLLRNENSKRWHGKRFAIKDPFLPKRNVSRTMTHNKSFDYCMGCFRNSYTYFGVLQTQTGPIFSKIYTNLTGESQFQQQTVERIEKAVELLMVEHPYFTPDPVKVMTVVELEEQLMRRAHQLAVSNFSELGVTISKAKDMYKRFNTSYLHYEFNPNHFIGKQTFPMVCTTCQSEGHTKVTCTEDDLSDYHPQISPLEKELLEAIDKLCEEVEAKWSPLPEELNNRRQIVAEIEEIMKAFYPTVKLEMFGSSCNGFGLRSSDVDICLTFTDSESGKDHDFVKLIEALQVKLHTSKILTELIPITTAKVPILKFRHIKTNFKGDISIYNTLGKENTRLLKMYADIDPRAKRLGFMIKRFGKECQICDASRGSLSSYAYILMVIYFLQQCNPPVLPVLQELSETEPRPEKIVEGCNAYFYDDIENLKKVWPDYGKNTETAGELWIKLLQFYSVDFDFTETVVAIKQKEKLLRFEKMWTSKCMAIEDPFDLTHNLGAGLSRKMHVFIVKTFRKAYGFFSSCDVGGIENHHLEEYFFNSKQLTSGAPPNDRGCRICNKLGHLCKECPIRKQSRQKKTGQNRGLKNTDPNVHVPKNQNQPPNPLRGFNPPFASPQNQMRGSLPYEFRGQYWGHGRPYFRNDVVKYGFPPSAPPFKSCASPVDMTQKNGVGCLPPFSNFQGNRNTMSREGQPLIFAYDRPRVMGDARPPHIVNYVPRMSEPHSIANVPSMAVDRSLTETASRVMGPRPVKTSPGMMVDPKFISNASKEPNTNHVSAVKSLHECEALVKKLGILHLQKGNPDKQNKSAKPEKTFPLNQTL